MTQQPIDLVGELREFGVPVSQQEANLLFRYMQLLLDWNKRINLISRRDTGNVWCNHILHSLSPLAYLDIPHGTRVLDIGTGGGLPGIPMAIVRSDLEVTLVDSIQKKMRAVGDMVFQLGLANVRVFTGRAEDLAREVNSPDSFDMAVARAVAPLCDLARWSKPLTSGRSNRVTRRRETAPAGKSEFHFPYLCALKGGEVSAEIGKTVAVAQPLSITEIDIHFPRQERLGLVDKKILIVEL